MYTTEQEYIDFVFPDDDTKTINDVVQFMVDNGAGTTEQCQTILKFGNPSIDWSF